MFSWHTWSPLTPINTCLNATAYLSVVTDHVHLIMTTGCHRLMAASSMILLHKAKVVLNWFHKNDNEFRANGCLAQY